MLGETAENNTWQVLRFENDPSGRSAQVFRRPSFPCLQEEIDTILSSSRFPYATASVKVSLTMDFKSA